MYVAIIVIVAVVAIIYFLSKNKEVDQAVITAAKAEETKVTGAITSDVNQAKQAVNNEVGAVTSEVKKEAEKI